MAAADKVQRAIDRLKLLQQRRDELAGILLLIQGGQKAYLTTDGLGEPAPIPGAAARNIVQARLDQIDAEIAPLQTALTAAANSLPAES